ncbi:MAG: cytidine deaminase [Candidatus Epulonipiscioides saccharophilum]|nr:MAG: cytidine deaminase [Epulopiscium sp. AS2M-Bin001]
MNYLELLQEAADAKQYSYAPYSNFRVGAALISNINHIFIGSNVEGASYGVTTCAERNAFYKAITEGERHFKAIAIVSDSNRIIYPCGICREVMNEFVDDDFVVICGNSKLEYEVYKLKDLLPHAIIPLDNDDNYN